VDKFDGVLQFLLGNQIFGSSLMQWLIAVVVAVVGFLLLQLVRAVFVQRASSMANGRAGEWFGAFENLLRQTKPWFLLVVSLYAGCLWLDSPKDAARVITAVGIIALTLQGAVWASAAWDFFIVRTAERRKETDAASATTIAALGFVGRLVIWTSAALLALSNLGYNVTTMVAGLGIGGVAVALAAQNILGDLFASASIVLDKPFVLGDFIVVGNEMGKVEYIGLKTTRLRSLSGEQLVFANTDLLKSRIHNHKRMSERRVLFEVGVGNDTPTEKVEAVSAMLREAVESQTPVRFDRAHFARISDSAFVFEVVYYVLCAEYKAYMDIQQAINLELLRRFREEQITLAFTT
jgi:small-conductance mechanosensitive channel